MKQHQGETIEYVVRRNGYNISDLARAIGVNRRTLYNYFKSAYIKSNIIYQIGMVLRHDFSKEFPELFKEGEFESISNQPATTTDKHNPFQEDEVVYKTKYLELLEKYHELLNSLLEAN